MSTTRSLIAAAAIGLATAGGAFADSAEKLVTIVTSDNAQTQLMSMVLTAAAVEQGAEARILLCGPGGDIALADAPESATAPQPPRDASPQGLMKMLMGRGVTVEVCAIYLPGLGADQSVLMEGVGVAAPPGHGCGDDGHRRQNLVFLTLSSLHKYPDAGGGITIPSPASSFFVACLKRKTAYHFCATCSCGVSQPLGLARWARAPPLIWSGNRAALHARAARFRPAGTDPAPRNNSRAHTT